jgi:hypothetical protein
LYFTIDFNSEKKFTRISGKEFKSVVIINRVDSNTDVKKVLTRSGFKAISVSANHLFILSKTVVSRLRNWASLNSGRALLKIGKKFVNGTTNESITELACTIFIFSQCEIYVLYSLKTSRPMAFIRFILY